MSTKMNTLNKEQLTKVLSANSAKVKKADGTLFDSVSYAVKQFRKDQKTVTKKDLLDLVKEVATTLGDTFKTPEFTPVAETSIKKPLKKSAPKKENVDSDSDTEESAPKKKSSTGGKKTSAKKTSDEKESSVSFPETIKNDLGDFELAKDISSMDDLYKALENGDNIIFAFYWSKKLLKQFEYFSLLGTNPSSFKNDLDLATAIYASEEQKVAYCVSLYTEAPYTVLPKDLDELEGVRYCSGCEFQIYREVA